MDCNGNATNGGRVGDEREREDEAASNIGRVSSVEDLEFGTGIPKELLQSPGPEFPESDQALLNNVAARFVLELFNGASEATQLGPVNPQNLLENKVPEESQTTSPLPSVAQGSLLEEKGGSILDAMPACVEGNGISREIPKAELSLIETTATKSNAVGFSATELLAPVENQVSIGGGTEAMAKSIPKASTSARFRQVILEPIFYRGGRGLSRILKGNMTRETLDFEKVDSVFQPHLPGTENWPRFRTNNFTRMRNQLRMSPSWAKPRPLELGPSSKTEPAGTAIILEHEQVNESAPAETQDISSDVSTGERPMSKALALLNPETLARVRLMLRKPIPETWVRFTRGRYIIQMPQQRLEWEDAYVKHILTSNRTGDKGMAGPQAAASEGQGIDPAMKPPNGIESESHASSQYDLRSGNLKSKLESASDISVDPPENDSKKPPNISEASALESVNENMAMLPDQQMESPPEEERKQKLNFFQKIGHRLHSRSSEKIPKVSSEDIAKLTGAGKADADIMAAKKSDPDEGNGTPAKRKLEWFETPVPSDLNFDDPIHQPLMPEPPKPRSRFRRFLDILLCRREPKAVDLVDQLETLQKHQRELDRDLQKQAERKQRKSLKKNSSG